MNHYPHHIGDFEAETRHLSRLERSIYRDMRDMYFKNESALDGSDMDLLARRLLCRSDDELAAMHFVLREFFEEVDDGQYLNQRCEREIAAFKSSQVGRGEVKSNENERKRRSRQRRAAMFSALQAAGVVVDGLTSMRDLYKIFRDHGISLPNFESVTPNVPSHVTAKGVTCHVSGTGNQNQNQNQSIPPNPPNGGAGAGGDASRQDTQPDQQGQGVDPMAVATALFAFFPEKRRTRLVDVSAELGRLLAAGSVTSAALLDAASRQSAINAEEAGRACPTVLRWVRESRWLDSGADAAAGGAVPSNWRETRSGVEAMGKRVGLPPYGESGYRLLSDYEAEVDRRLQADEVAA